MIKENLKSQFLEKFLQNSAFTGWNEESFMQSALDLGFDKKYGYILFSNGLEEIAHYFNEIINDKLISQIDNLDLANVKIREKIQIMLMQRLQIILSHKQAVRQLNAFYQFPPRIAKGLKEHWKVADIIWQKCNDTSTDYNYYSKRLILARIHQTSITYILSAANCDLIELEEFVQNKINKVMEFEKTKSNLKKKLKNIPFIRLLIKSN
jgi:ubiquinone biosynthesis protein COQ9